MGGTNIKEAVKEKYGASGASREHRRERLLRSNSCQQLRPRSNHVESLRRLAIRTNSRRGIAGFARLRQSYGARKTCCR